MTSLNRKQIQPVSVDTKQKRYIATFVCYNTDLSTVGDAVKQGNATMVKVELDEDVKLEDKKVGF